ncbi:high affinity immunoglobulin epsilon receptor subunit beta [Dasypus novemcinctus]|uniref:high affinity immunoglobulin epsilon receptor subunit beta n=1 Tax=Dasypus novemcinctus TaxID=9361 RepID=UPI00265F8AAC|nr:high affinity immunoglobulin epsilon receptor subunit beta [Dasypus novemcinctus]
MKLEMESTSRADLALPSPQQASSIELSETAFHGDIPKRKAVLSPPQRTWLTFLKNELEFLGVTQILIGSICLCFGTIVCSMLNTSEFEPAIFLSFDAGYPFWGALFFAISGFLSIISEKRNITYLAYGRLGANTVSSIVGAMGIAMLILNLQESAKSIHDCPETDEDDFCLLTFFSMEIVMIILFLTILGFCGAVSIIVYGVGEILKRAKLTQLSKQIVCLHFSSNMLPERMNRDSHMLVSPDLEFTRLEQQLKNGAEQDPS